MSTDFYGLPISRTNRDRMAAARRWARYGAYGLVALCCALGVAGFYRSYIRPERVDVADIAQQTTNKHAQIGQFASEFVRLWLTVTNADAAALNGFVDVATAGPWIDNPTPATTEAHRTPAASVVITAPAAVVDQGGVGEVDMFAVTVTASVRALPTSTPRTEFYRVPVSMFKAQPRAIGWPEPTNGPGPGVHVKPDYPVSADVNSKAYSIVAQFISVYLTQTSGLDRYVLADSDVWPVGGYSAARLVSLRLNRQVPDQPGPGDTLACLARVEATTNQHVPLPMTMALHLENNNGTWMIVGLDLAPAISDDDPEPVGSSR